LIHGSTAPPGLSLPVFGAVKAYRILRTYSTFLAYIGVFVADIGDYDWVL
jgi:hypothetical protein